MPVYVYQAFGLTFSLPFLCSRLQALDVNITPDITIQFSTEKSAQEKYFFLAENAQKATLVIPNVATFEIQNGNKITVTSAEEAALDAVLLFLFGSAFGIILYQRGYLLLHGCTIEYNSQCHSFVGDSGIGKSTLAAYFALSNFRIISDDVCAIKTIDDKPYVFPGFPDIKLWESALTQYGLSQDTLRPVRPTEKKFYWPLTDWNIAPVPLTSVSQLNIGENFTCKKESGFKKYQIITNNSYRPEYISSMGLNKKLFKQVSALLPKIKTYNITRPSESFDLESLRQQIIANIFSD